MSAAGSAASAKSGGQSVPALTVAHLADLCVSGFGPILQSQNLVRIQRLLPFFHEAASPLVPWGEGSLEPLIESAGCATWLFHTSRGFSERSPCQCRLFKATASRRVIAAAGPDCLAALAAKVQLIQVATASVHYTRELATFRVWLPAQKAPPLMPYYADKRCCALQKSTGR